MGDIIKVVIVHDHQGAEGLNRFYYLASDAALDLLELAAGLAVTLVDVLRDITSHETKFKSIHVEDVIDGRAAALDLENVSGRVGGDSQPSFVSWTYHLVPSIVSVIKRGRKAFVGVAEDWTDDNTPNNLYMPDLAELASYLYTTIVGDGWSLLPALAKYLSDGDKEYWYLVTLAGALFRHISTQNSRKFFRGSGSAGASLRIPAKTATLSFDASGDENTFSSAYIQAKYANSDFRWGAVNSTPQEVIREV